VRLLPIALLMLAGCDALNPRPGPIRAMAPRPNPPAAAAHAATAADPLRQNPWLGRFWEEMTPAQQRRVAARLRRSPRRATAAEAPQIWDVMGLADREALVFGRAAPRPQATAAAP
jgi:hypothetical protein